MAEVSLNSTLNSKNDGKQDISVQHMEIDFLYLRLKKSIEMWAKQPLSTNQMLKDLEPFQMYLFVIFAATFATI